MHENGRSGLLGAFRRVPGRRPALDGYPGALLRELPAPSPAPGPDQIVTEADLADLPPVVRTYLRSMGVVGRPRQASLLARWQGRFRLRPGGRWFACEAWQRNTADPVERLFGMRLHWGPLVMNGSDVYRQGRGRMRGTVLGVVPVASGSGPRFDTSELVTWLDDALLLAPSMLLRPGVSWRAGPAPDALTVSLTDAGRTVEATARLDDTGAPRDVVTDDRYADLPGGLERARWSTPVDGWRTVDGRRVPTTAHALWYLVGGPFRYAEMTLVDLVADTA